MPDTLVIIFFVAILTSLATWVVPVGMFDSQEVQYQVDGQTKTRKVVDPHSFRILTNEAGEPEYHRVQLFTTGDERPGLMNFPFEGLTSGSKYGTAVGIIMFMLVIGGAFGIVMRTGTIDNGILALIRHTRGNEILFIPALFILFSLGGAIFGMGEEAVAFAIIIAPLMVRLKRRTKNAKAFHDKCENFSFRASNETAVLITAFYSLHGDHLGYG